MKTRHWLRWIAYIVIGALAVCIVGFIIWFALVANPMASYEGNISLKEISDITGIKFPPTAKLLHGKNTGFADTTLDAELEIDRADVDSFVRSAKSAHATPGKDKVLISHKDRLGISNDKDGASSWWKPDSCQRFIAITADRAWDHSESVSILIGLDNPKHAVIYLEYAAD